MRSMSCVDSHFSINGDEVMDSNRPEPGSHVQQIVRQFVARFDESYRLLAYHAALPLVLTPELLNYLRNTFLRGQVPWVAEVDLLLSDMCRQVGYELYAMDTEVRAYLLDEMRATLGLTRMQEVARLLINYVRHLSLTNPAIAQHELQAQQWAAMVYLDEQREAAVRQIAMAFRHSLPQPSEQPIVDHQLIDRAEFARLSHITQQLAPQLAEYPDLIRYAELVSQILHDTTAARTIAPETITQVVHVADIELPSLSPLLSRNSIVEAPTSPDVPATQDYTYDVYISYSDNDRVWVMELLLPRLEDAGLRVCIDVHDFLVGISNLVNVDRAVNQSRYTLLVLTPAWVQSEWSTFESILISTLDPVAHLRRLLPLLLEPCQPPTRIAMLTYADFTQKDQWEVSFQRIIATIEDSHRLAEIGPSLGGLIEQREPGDYLYDVFISYSHDDRDWVIGWLLVRLEVVGLRVCIDVRDFDVGVATMVNLERAVNQSRCVLLVLTPAWVQSEWVAFESILVSGLNSAPRSRRLLPLLLEPCQPPIRIAMLTYADFTQKDQWDAQFQPLLQVIQHEIQTTPRQRQVAPQDRDQKVQDEQTKQSADKRKGESLWQRVDKRVRNFFRDTSEPSKQLSQSSNSYGIFISYRREDSAGHVGWLRDLLSQRFGTDEILRDIDTIPSGADFVEAIEAAVESCEVLLVVIGPRWLTATDGQGQRRLDYPEDFVRIEIAAALEHNIPVIPVLVQDAQMPRSDELPPAINKLARRQAVELRDASWDYDVERLSAALGSILSRTSRAPEERKQVQMLPEVTNRTLNEGRREKAVILLVDTDQEFLETRRELLELSGFNVKVAVGLADAQRTLEQGGIDLAIIEIRLVDATDTNDFSGLDLAKQVGPTVPVIIWTSYPSLRWVREALSGQFNNPLPAVDFIAKQDGIQAFVTAVNVALQRQQKRDEPQTVKLLRVIVAAPHDTQSERDSLADIIAELNRGVAADHGIRLELTQWETDAFPGFHPAGPQGLIDPILRITDSDMLIGIFWKHFGEPINDEQSGTEHEFLMAYESWKRNGRPQIMVYFKQESYRPTTNAEIEQWGQVLEFQRTFPHEGLWWSYKTKADFEKLVRQHLAQFILGLR